MADSQAICRRDPDRNLALELVRVTEAAAIAAGRFMGRGDKERVDQAAVDAMRPVLASIAMDGIVVIGEGEKDEAPMLYNGEHIGNGSPPAVDIAVDPVDGTTLTAKALPDALAVVAVAERGAMFDPGPCVYMEKLAVAGDVADAVDIEAPIEDNLRARSPGARGKRADDVTVAILDRPRHAELVQRVLADGRADQVPARRRRRRARSSPPTRTRRSTCCVGIGGTPGGRHRGVRDEVPGRRDLRASSTRATTASAGRRSKPGYDLDTGPRRPTTSSPATTSSSPPPASPTASCCAACATRRGACSRSRSRCARSPARCA